MASHRLINSLANLALPVLVFLASPAGGRARSRALLKSIGLRGPVVR